MMETTASPLRRQLDERLDQLTPEQQQHVLHLLNDLITPGNELPTQRWWESLSHTITAEDAEIMRQASLECRPIEPDTTPTW